MYPDPADKKNQVIETFTSIPIVKVSDIDVDTPPLTVSKATSMKLSYDQVTTAGDRSGRVRPLTLLVTK